MTTVRITKFRMALLCIGLLGSMNRVAGTTTVPLFVESERCVACHSNITTPSGQDISIGYQWRASMMALSARDPYWRASVRRESLDHPTASAAIEDRCSVCHMPVAHTQARAADRAPEIFSILEKSHSDPASVHKELDGVTCTVCHQIKPDNFGQHSSFDGGYRIDVTQNNPRSLYGPFEVDTGRQRAMHSSTEHFLPVQGEHIRQSELCATCHTLYTTALDGDGKPVGELPEQVPYIEWLQSSFAGKQSCQSCHMPPVGADVPISATLGQPRPGVAQHQFIGGNAYMLRLLSRHRDQLGVVAQPAELETSALRTEKFLQTHTAQLEVGSVQRVGGRLQFTINVRNLSGHKFPTAYPSRRAWLHLQVRDASGRTVFESGALRSDGSVEGNDNDANAQSFEPHHDVIRQAGEVQIYESVMVDYAGRVTTSLLSGLRYVKDNRLLPAGFERQKATADVAVHGVGDDADFQGGADRVRYDIDVGATAGPLSVSVEMLFQPIGYRWARNLSGYDAAETRSFVGWYDASAAQSASLIASAQAEVR